MACLFLLPILAGNVRAADVDITSPGFKLTVCDGPAEANITKDPNYVPCDFNGLMKQIQHFIDIAIVLGVLAAIVGFTWSGWLYIKGNPGDIKKAHEIFPKVFIGFIIMLSAWFIVYQILAWLTDNPNLTKLLGNNL